MRNEITLVTRFWISISVKAFIWWNESFLIWVISVVKGRLWEFRYYGKFYRFKWRRLLTWNLFNPPTQTLREHKDISLSKNLMNITPKLTIQ